MGMSSKKLPLFSGHRSRHVEETSNGQARGATLQNLPGEGKDKSASFRANELSTSWSSLTPETISTIKRHRAIDATHI